MTTLSPKQIQNLHDKIFLMRKFFLEALKNNTTSKKKNTKHLKFNTNHLKQRSKVTKLLDGSLKNNPLQI